MNYWEELPDELQGYIIKILKNETAKDIQRIWRGRYDCCKYAHNIAKKHVDGYTIHSQMPYIDSLNPKTPTEIKYCMKHGQFKNNYIFWQIYIALIESSFLETDYQYSPESIYHTRTKIETEKLKIRLLYSRKYYRNAIP